MEPEKKYDPQEQITITLTREQWERVEHWLDFGRCYHNDKAVECLHSINNRDAASQKAAEHKLLEEKAANLWRIIEDILNPPPVQETEE